MIKKSVSTSTFALFCVAIGCAILVFAIVATDEYLRKGFTLDTALPVAYTIASLAYLRFMWGWWRQGQNEKSHGTADEAQEDSQPPR